MSTSWTFTTLCQSENLTGDGVTRVVHRLATIGLGPQEQGAPIYGMTADGSGGLVFGSLQGAASWLGSNEGLLALHSQARGFELGVSVRRHASILTKEMDALSDETSFDVLAFTVSDWVLREQPAAVWPFVEMAILTALDGIDFEFAFGLNEDLQELLSQYCCVHRRVLEGRLPPFIPWWTSVREASPLRGPLTDAARAAGREMRSVNGLLVLTITDQPTHDATQAVVEASERWRTRSDDTGC